MRLNPLVSIVVILVSGSLARSQSPPNYKTDAAVARWKAIKASSGKKSCGNGFDFIDGGDGLDTVQFRGKRAEYRIVRNSDHSYTVVDLVPCRAETDIVINVERFAFADGVYSEAELYQVAGSDQKPVPETNRMAPVPIELISPTAPGAEAKAWIGADRRAWTIRDSIRLGSGFAPEPDWSKIPNLCFKNCPQIYFVKEVPGVEELHLIGVYQQAKPVIQPDGRVVAKGIKVFVRPTATPLILMLTSYEPAMWEIEADAGAKLKEIWIGGYHPGKVVKSPQGAVVKTIPGRIYGLDPNGREGDSGASLYLSAARTLAGMDVTSFQSNYDGVEFDVPFYGDKAMFAEIRKGHELALKSKTVQKVDGSFPWVDGNEIKWQGNVPVGMKIKFPVRLAARTSLNSVTYSETDGRLYGANSHGFFVIDAASGVATKLAPPPGYPSMTWLAGVAYEPKSGRVFIASTWHAGHHHTFDPKTKEWRVFDIAAGGGGFTAIGYDAVAKRMLAIRKNDVVSLDSNFKPARVVGFKNEFARLGQPGNTAQMAVAGEWIIVQAKDPMSSPGDSGSKFMINVGTGELRTYGGE